MAIGIRVKLSGITQEQFDQGHDQINPDRTPPQGLLFHASGPIDGGWGIIDFWESRADFDAFAPRIAEGMAAAGIEPQGSAGHQGVPRARSDQRLARPARRERYATIGCGATSISFCSSSRSPSTSTRSSRRSTKRW